MKIFLLFIIQLSFSYYSFAQTTFERTYDGGWREWGNSLIITTDSNYVFTGENNNYPPTTGAAYLMKVNQVGDTVFAKTYWAFSEGVALLSTYDGGFIIGGEYDSVLHGTPTALLIKTDAVGDTEWVRTYSTGVVRSIKQLPDSGYILTAGSIIRINSLGDTIWTRNIEASLSLGISSLDLTSDSSFILTGTTLGYDIALVKIYSSGDTLWTKYFDGGANDFGNVVKINSDGGFIIVATTDDTLIHQTEIWVIKTDSAGDSLWSKKISGINYTWF